VAGLKQGQLPPGYLPLTAANKLDALAAYSKQAVASIAAQDGSVPGIAPGFTAPPIALSFGSPVVVPTGSSPTRPTVSDSPSAAPSPTPSSSAPTIKAKPAATGKTLGVKVSAPGVLLMILIALALLGPIGVPAVSFARRLRRSR
jgi:hypothetical protein